MKQYRDLVRQVLTKGVLKESRNADTISISGTQLKFDAKNIPLLNGRKIFYKGVFGEFAAFMQNAQTVQEFKDLGCNYWDMFAKEDGTLILDYCQQLHQWVGDSQYSQLDILKEDLAHNTNSRRIIVNLWVPENIHFLSLPCCHYSYQFIVTNGKLDMIWTQRSADVMLGIPADMILAWLWVTCLCRELDLKPGEVTMNFGDTHIYVEHLDGAREYEAEIRPRTKANAILSDKFSTIETFMPDMIKIENYNPHEIIKFKLF